MSEAPPGSRNRAVVLEVNEVPLSLFRHFAERYPASNIARLLDESGVLVTEANDVAEDVLYPSQTWASFNTGAPYDRHRIHWYNDPKPDRYPFYWQILARHGRTVGLVNTLHAGAAAERLAQDDRIRFLLPDVFAADSDTRPARYRAFHRFTCEMAGENRRVTSFRPGAREIRVGCSLPWLGVRIRTLVELAATVAQTAAGRRTRERLRNAHFTLTADIFTALLKRHDVDLAVFFTNHLAGNMHRYWYALFPEEYSEAICDEDRVQCHADEILFACRQLDAFIGEMMNHCRATGRVLLVVSSMGQCARRSVDTRRDTVHQIGDVDRFLSVLGAPSYPYRSLGAMFPQYSLAFDGEPQAREVFRFLRDKGIHTAANWLDINDNVVTITLRQDDWLDRARDALGSHLTPDALGLEPIRIEDHPSTRHHPDGTLLIYPGSPPGRGSPSRVGYLEFAPALLAFFGLPRPDHMVEPGFTIA